MKVAVIGATGKTGQAVVETARARGHQVVAVARSAADRDWPEQVSAAGVDVRDAAAVTRALDGSQAAVFAVGVGAARVPTTAYSAGIRNVAAALATGARLSLISAVPVGPRSQLPVNQRVAAVVLDRIFGASYQDMARMEATCQRLDLDWICLRPPRLVNRAQRDYRLDPLRPPGGAISRADLAAALLDVLDQPDRFRRSWYVAN